MATLRELVESEMETQGESEEDIVSIVVGRNSWSYGPDTQEVGSLADLEQYEGSTGYGGENLPGIHVWTHDRLYFKGTYDGSEWVTSKPRNPTADEAPGSVGGG